MLTVHVSKKYRQYIMEHKPNILTVLPTYSRTGVEGTILELKRELKEQRQVNTLLKENNYEDKAQDIQEFVERNEGEIDDQLLRLSEVVMEIKKVVAENSELEANESKYDNLVKSENAQRVAEKLLQLKALKKDALTFLEDSGIIIPHIN